MTNNMFNYFDSFDFTKNYSDSYKKYFSNYFKHNQELFFSFYENIYKNANDINKKNKAAYDELATAIKDLSQETESDKNQQV